MDPSKARKILLSQHDELRHSLAGALRVCDFVTSGRGATAVTLREAIERVNDLFALHNATEEALLAPLLREDYAWGQARIDRMLEEHTGEHAEIRAALSMDGTLAEAAARVRDAIEMIEAHMAAEERTFLARSVLRDTLVQVDETG